MCVRRLVANTLLLLALLITFAVKGRTAQAQLIPGLESWADATVGLSTTKWKGARVPYPTPMARPETLVRLDSPLSPISVHGHVADGERLLAVLQAAEAVHALTSAAGLLTSFGDAGQGGSGGRDLYVTTHPTSGAAAYLDASGNFAALDGGRAFGVVDVRVPRERLFVCTAQALFEAQLLELDPAEAEILRRSSAAYFSTLIAGGRGCEEGSESDDLSRDNPFADPSQGADWWRQLSARQDQNRGVFMHEMWQFARQRTWEGRDVRASPDLFEAIAKALELERVDFAHVVSELAALRARKGFAPVRSLVFDGLPAFLPNRELGPLAGLATLVRLRNAQAPGVRLRVWSKGAAGARYVLAATRLDADDEPLSYHEAPVLKDPNAQLSVELDGNTRAVLITVVNLGREIPDFDPPVSERSVALTIDHFP